MKMRLRVTGDLLHAVRYDTENSIYLIRRLQEQPERSQIPIALYVLADDSFNSAGTETIEVEIPESVVELCGKYKHFTDALVWILSAAGISSLPQVSDLADSAQAARRELRAAAEETVEDVRTVVGDLTDRTRDSLLELRTRLARAVRDKAAAFAG